MILNVLDGTSRRRLKCPGDYDDDRSCQGLRGRKDDERTRKEKLDAVKKRVSECPSNKS
jgi:hypothetical protein